MISKHKFTVISLLLLLFVTYSLEAQNSNETHKYWVLFKDKPNVNFDPFEHFDSKAIERRMIQELPLYDWYDLPVDSEYKNEIEKNVQEIKTESRWLNALVVIATQKEISKIKEFHFVKEINEAGTSELLIAEEEEPSDDLVMLSRQTERMGIDLFDSLGLNGTGMRVAIFDVGFNGAKTHEAFKHIYEKNRVKLTYDFVKKREDVYSGGSHGTAVWSCIGGRLQNRWSGMAHEAEFLLARTEIGMREPFSEEENWIVAAEWADKNGADIINSSLGYTHNRYFPTEMDGKTSFVTKGANIAAKKGILVVNAAGNEGSGNWKLIGAPADADSVLSIGGVVPCCDYKTGFSSFGPTADGRLKPNVMAQGTAWCAKPVGEGSMDGTSFASPLAAGFAACAWQHDRKLGNMELFRKLEACGSLYPYFDYGHGYGVLSAQNFIGTDENTEAKFEVLDAKVDNETFYKIVVNDDILNAFTSPGSILLYVSVFNQNGKLDSYKVIDVSEKEAYSFSSSEIEPNSVIKLFLQGYLKEIKF
ncbi:MAG: S8 family serine peptidase [Bacteroidia bacterium]